MIATWHVHTYGDTSKPLPAGWIGGHFEVVWTDARDGRARRAGFLRDHLGLSLIQKASPKGHRKARWSLAHLNTGHRIIQLFGPLPSVMALADEIAALGDWSFAGLKGWINVDPGLPEKVQAFAAARPGRADFRFREGADHYDEAASAIYAAREGRPA